MDGPGLVVYDSAMSVLARSTVAVRILYVSSRRGLTWNHPHLAAPYWRFYWNTAGESSVRLPDRAHRLDHRIGYLIPPDTDFAAIAHTVIDHFYIHFVLDAPMASFVPGIFRADSTATLEPLVVATEDALATDANSPQVTLCASALVLAALSAVPHEAFAFMPDVDDSIVRAVALIDHNLAEKISLARIAQSAGCSERSLRRRFSQQFGQSPTAFVATRRIEHACILLHFSDLSVKQIAERCGFTDRYHLTRVFKRERGVGPATFRRMRMEQELRA